MLYQVILRILVVAVVAVNVQSRLIYTKPCADCEEEIWEEIPCDSVDSPPLTTSTTTAKPETTSPPTTTTTTTQAPAPSYPTVIGTVESSPPYDSSKQKLSMSQIESNEGYKSCYCECKSGCKEFCRKVVLHPDEQKHILQYSKTVHPNGQGSIEVKHTHERNVVSSSNSNPSYESSSDAKNQEQLAYAEPKSSYNVAPALETNQEVQPVPAPSPAPAPAPSVEPYSVSSGEAPLEDFAKLLQSQYTSSVASPNYNNYPSETEQNPGNAKQQYSQQSNDLYSNPRSDSGPANVLISKEPYLGQVHTNSIPRVAYFPAVHSQMISGPSYAASYGPPSVDAQTALGGNGDGIAVARASSSDDYKTSSSLTQKPKDDNESYSKLPRSQPVQIRYTDTPAHSGNIDPVIDNYLQQLLYLDPYRLPNMKYQSL